jgi:hypothetical protein
VICCYKTHSTATVSTTTVNYTGLVLMKAERGKAKRAQVVRLFFYLLFSASEQSATGIPRGQSVNAHLDFCG